MLAAQTLGAAVDEAAQTLRRAGIDQPAVDARLLVTHVLGIDAIEIFTRPALALSEGHRQAIGEVMERRLAREPVSRIVGWRWFRGRKFLLGSETLDPRPDSETLIDQVLAFVHEHGLAQAPLRLLDVGTGTGCLLLTLLSELPAACGVGVDLSAQAIAMAATNATNLGIGPERVSFVQCAATEFSSGIFNIIVANPPYIPTEEISTLEPEVRLFDPSLALDGGLDGLACYRTWTPPLAASLTKPLAMLIFEVGVGQAETVATLLQRELSDRAHQVMTARDIGGIDRCVAAVTR